MDERKGSMPQIKAKIPVPVVRRLPRYLIYVRELQETGVEWVSSLELAQALALTSSTVRQDLSHLDMSGVSKRGYRISDLETVLVDTLGGTRTLPVVVVGAGLLGSAIAQHGNLEKNGFEVRAILDSDPALVGKKEGSLRVIPMRNLKKVVADKQIEIGIIAVPSEQAQQVADDLIAAGLKALLNLALVHIQVPEDVTLTDIRIVVGLQELAYGLGRG